MPGSADEAGAEQEYRPLLFSIAYGMTGAVGDAVLCPAHRGRPGRGRVRWLMVRMPRTSAPIPAASVIAGTATSSFFMMISSLGQ